MLLDFNCPHDKVRDEHTGVPGQIRQTLADSGWETAVGTQADEIFQRMAAELPAEDLPSFVRNTRTQMIRKSPHAELTIGHFEDEGIGKARVRIRAYRNAALPELGQRTATQLLTLNDLTLINMDLYESRDSDPILQGYELTPFYKLFQRENLAVSIPFLVASLLLAIGFIVAEFGYHLAWGTKVFLGDPVWIWYGRLLGPLFMAVVTTGAVILRDMRRRTERRADWDLGFARPNHRRHSTRQISARRPPAFRKKPDPSGGGRQPAIARS